MKRHVVPVLALFALSLALYANAFHNEFVWDDELFIINAKEIRHIDLPRFFSEGNENLYRPLRTVLYAATYHYGGLDPAAYHLVGKTLNALTVAALYALLILLFENRGAAFLGALLFAAHPIHTEKVTFITSTYDIPADLLWLSAFALYVLHRKRQPMFALTGSVLLFATGLLFGENAAVLPLVIVLYDLTFGDRDKKAALWIPYFAVLAMYLGLRTAVLGSVARAGEHTLNPDLFGNFLTMSEISLLYGKLLIWPWPLIAIRNLNQAVFPYPLHLYAAAIAIVALLAAAWRQRHQRPWVPFTAFWFFVVISPNLNFIPTGNLMSERYVYLPSAVLSFTAAAGYLAVETNRKERAALLMAALIVIAGFSVLTVRRNGDWRNDTLLWSRTLLVKPDSPAALANLGVEAQKNHSWDISEKLLKRAIELEPEGDKTLEHLANLYIEQGRRDEALPLLEKAYALRKRDPLLLKIAQVKIDQKKFSEAETLLNDLLRRHPNSSRAWMAYGGLRYFQGKEGWAAAYIHAHALSSEKADVIYRLAVGWRLLGKTGPALRIARIGLQEDPDNKQLLELAAGLEAEKPEKRLQPK